jgi:hypothetical protein
VVQNRNGTGVARDDRVNLESSQFRRKLRKSVGRVLCKAPLDLDALAKTKIDNQKLVLSPSTLLRINFVEVSKIGSPNYSVCSGQDVGWNGHIDLLRSF